MGRGQRDTALGQNGLLPVGRGRGVCVCVCVCVSRVVKEGVAC